MRPRLHGEGPPTCSTSMELAVCPGIIWDTNRYYADLGVDVHATRAQIRQAYLASDQGVRLTFVVKQLLDPEVRRAYDRTPLGSVYFDAEIEERVRRVAALNLSEGAGRVSASVDATSTGVVDTEGLGMQAPVRTNSWPFAYYLWGTDQADLDRLREWQSRLVATLGRQKEHHQIAVGLMSGMESPVKVTVQGYRIVVFLDDGEGPTDALASSVAPTVILLSESETHHGTPQGSRSRR